jgi:hypothetical protein
MLEKPDLPDELLVACLYDGYLLVGAVYGDSCRHSLQDSSSEMVRVARTARSRFEMILRRRHGMVRMWRQPKLMRRVWSWSSYPKR